MEQKNATNRDHRHLLSSTPESRSTTESRTSKSGQRQVWHKVFLDAGHGSYTPGKRAK